MAIQNDNTFLSKGDLKAYHEKILPYLGGNMMMSTNNSDFYSTDEKVVGVWTDGKPLYQKTLVNNTATSGNKDLIIGTIAGAETIFIVSGFYINNTSDVAAIGAVMDLNTSGRNSDTRYASYTYVRPNGNVGVYYGSATATTKTIATVRYTKTTDSASTALTTPGVYDINFPNTWPANKEIYFGNGVYGYRATGTHNIEESTRTDTSIINIGNSSKFVSFGGSVSWSSTSTGTDLYQNPLPFDSPLKDGSKPVSVQLVKVGSGEVCLRTWGNVTYSNLPYDIWFTYIK